MNIPNIVVLRGRRSKSELQILAAIGFELSNPKRRTSSLNQIFYRSTIAAAIHVNTDGVKFALGEINNKVGNRVKRCYCKFLLFTLQSDASSPSVGFIILKWMFFRFRFNFLPHFHSLNSDRRLQYSGLYKGRKKHVSAKSF